jgi:hypothetical protein
MIRAIAIGLLMWGAFSAGFQASLDSRTVKLRSACDADHADLRRGYYLR